MTVLILALALSPAFAKEFGVVEDLYVGRNTTTPYGGIGKYQNMLTRSEDFTHSDWAKTNTSPSNGITGPDGETTADSIAPTSATATNVKQTSDTTAVALTAYTFSVWLKVPSGAKSIELTVGDSASSSGTTASVTTDWQRFSASYTAGSSPSGNVFAQIGDATWTANTIHAWGAQLEQETYPRVYVKTGATAVATESFGIVSNNNLAIIGTVDGRDVSVDGAKLDGITAGAADTTDDSWTGTGDIYMTSGNVGIGTTGPTALLHVNGSFNLGGVTSFSGWDTQESNDVLKTTDFAGDVTGTYNATVVGDDSHSHTSSTLPATTSYLGVAIESAEITDGTIATADIAAAAITKAKLAELHATGNGDMTVAVAAGDVFVSGNTLVAFAGANAAIGTAHATNPRIDLITLTSGGALSVTAGTAASSPSAPTYPADELAIAEVYVPANTTVINTADGGNGYIYKDCRPFLNLGAGQLFKTIAVTNDPAQSSVVADAATDTVTLAAGDNIQITTNASTDTITIAASGGSIHDQNTDTGTTSTTFEIDSDASGATLSASALTADRTFTFPDTAGTVALTSDLSSYQPLDTGLTSISGLTTSADKMIYTTASDTYATATLTSAGRALIDDANADAQKATLSLDNVTNVQQMPLNYLDTTTTLGTSDVLVPSQNAVKAYVDAGIAGLSWKEAVISIGDNTPPGSPSAGNRYVLGASPTGVWENNANKMAEYSGSSWSFEAPEDGDAVFAEDVDTGYVYTGSAWTPFSGASAYTWGNALVNSSDLVIDVGVDDSTIEVNADALRVKDSGITSAKIANDSIVNADIKSDAAIAGTKISPNFGSQTILTTGNVGIGTTGPSRVLEVAGASMEFRNVADTEGLLFNILGNVITLDAQAAGSSNAIDIISQTRRVALSNFAIGNNEVLGVGAWEEGIVILSESAKGIRFGSNVTYNVDAAPDMIIVGGNVGIGTTGPASELQVDGTVQATGIKMTTSPSAGYVLTSDADGVASWTDISASGGAWTLSGTDLYPDSATYNVGIGTTDPGAALAVGNNAFKVTSAGAVTGGTYNTHTIGHSTHAQNSDTGTGGTSFTIGDASTNVNINAGSGTFQLSSSGIDIDTSGNITNAGFDANGTGNSITNLETADFASGVIDSTTTLGTSETKLSTQNAIKVYVDNSIAGLKWKDSVKASTTANGALASAYEAGDTIDGVQLAENDRILIKNQTTETENGIYVVNASGEPDRASDANANAEVVQAAVFVEQGTINADTAWVCSNDAVILGTTDLAFAQFAGSQLYQPGDGLAISGQEFSVNVDNSTLEIDSDILRVKNDGITSAKINNNEIVNEDLFAGSFANITGVGTLGSLNVTGNVGIGTTGPTQALEVVGNIAQAGEATALYLDYGSSGAEDHDIYLYFGDDGDNTAHSIRWDDGLSAFLTQEKLMVNTITEAGSAMTIGPGGADRDLTLKTGPKSGLDGANILIDPNTSGAATLTLGVSGDNDIIAIHGNVGIGTTGPTALLSIGATEGFKVDTSGNITTAGDLTIGTTALAETTSATDSGAYKIGAYTTGFSNSSSTNVQAVLGDFDSAIGTAGAQDLWKTISGDTGSTAANIATDTLTIAGAGIASTAMSGDTLTVTATEADTLQTVAARGATFTGGNVGIGTTNPVYALDVGGGASGNSIRGYNLVAANNIAGANFYITHTGASGNWVNGVDFQSSATGAKLKANTTNDIQLGNTTNGVLLHIKGTTGNVGIGTTAPIYKLDVRGTGYFSDNITLAADKTVDGVDISDYSSFFIDSAGSNTQLWFSDGSGKGAWLAQSSVNAGTVDGYEGADLDVTILTSEVSGILPIANGGTAASTAGVARSNLGLGDLAEQNAASVPALTMAGNIGMGGSYKVTGLAAPSGDNDAVRKIYVDNAIAGLKWKESVKAASTAAGTLAGASSSFRTGQLIDGYTLVEGDRILIKDQALDKENGIYIVATGTGPARATDASTEDELIAAAVFVEQGTSFGDTAFVCSSNTIAAIDTNDVDFVQFSGAQAYTWGDGLDNSGTVISVGAGTGISVAADTVGIDNTVVATLSDTQTLSNKTISAVANGLTVGTSQLVVSGGNVGIGTTAPTATLHVGAGKTVSFPADSISDAMVSDTLTASDLVAGSEVVADGEVADNITISASGSVADGALESTIDRTIFNASDYITAEGGIHVGGTSDPGTDTLIVDGNVGIGTTAPVGILDARIDTNAFAKMYLGTNANGYNGGEIHFVGAGGISNAYLAGGYINTPADSGYIKFVTNNPVDETEVMRIIGGLVGIGTTIPSQELHVAGDARITGGIYDSNNEVGGAGQVLKSTGSSIDWVDASSLPADDATTLDSLDSTDFAILAGQANGQALSGGTAASESLTLDSTAHATKGYVLVPSSNVGIGTATATQKLHVQGNIAVTGTVDGVDIAQLKTDADADYDAIGDLPTAAVTNGAATTISTGDQIYDFVIAQNYITDGNTNWDNSYGYITASTSDTLTNKSIDVDNNTLSNIETDNFKAGVISTSASLGTSNTVLPTQGAIKGYVDTKIAGLSWKDSVKVATIANADWDTAFDNGSTLDGIALTTDDRILIKDQTDDSDNGIYIVQESGAPVRADYANTASEINQAAVFVEQGTNADTAWVCTNDSITLETTALTFAQFSGSQTYQAGDGLSFSSNQINIDVSDFAGAGLEDDGSENLRVGAGTGITVNANDVALNTTYTDGRYLRADASTTQGDGLYIAADEIRARDAGGLKLYDDAGTAGLFVEDGGQVGIGTSVVDFDLDIGDYMGFATTGILFSDTVQNFQLTHTGKKDIKFVTRQADASYNYGQLDLKSTDGSVAMNGNVGIGTTAPTGLLHVGNATNNVKISSAAAMTFAGTGDIDLPADSVDAADMNLNYVTSVATTSPLSGGAAASEGTAISLSIADAAADGSTKGAASFTAADFNASSGNISIDYTNAQAAASGTKGFLTGTDWDTFNNKSDASDTLTGLVQSTASGTNYITGGNLGIGTTTPGSSLDIDPTNATSVTVEDIAFRSSSQTLTLTDGTTITSQRHNQFIAPTLDGVAAGATETVTNAATLYIDAAPSGSNITITNPYALWIDSGNARVDGTVESTGIKMTASPGAGYVLTSDANGVASWADLSSSGGAWTLTDDDLYPDATNYNVAIGATDAGTADLFVAGNVGIGTTAPTAVLAVGNNAFKVTSAGVATWSGGGSANANTAYTHSQATTDVHGLTFTGEGTGGGLDADTVDGEHATAFQDADADLTAIAALSSADSNFIVGSASGWVAETGATARTSLGLGNLAEEDASSVPALTMAGNIGMGGSYKVTGLAEPSGDNDAVRKIYVDNAIAGLKWKESVKAATTENGAWTSDFDDLSTIDGVQLSTNDRILIKDQTLPKENGIYIVQSSGAPARAADASTEDELIAAAVFVEQGDTFADTAFVCSSNEIAVIDTDVVDFVQFAGSQSYQAGDGVSFSGNQINVGAGTGITVGADTVGINNAVVATLSDTQTLTNKTLTSPKINEDVALTPTSTELNYVDGVTSAIQTQIDGKSAASDTLTGLVQSTASGTNYIAGGNLGIGTTSPTSLIHSVDTMSAATGNEIAYNLAYATNKAAGNDTGLLIAMTDTASPGTSNLLDMQVDTASKFTVDNSGNVTIAGDLTLGSTALAETTSATDSGAYKIGAYTTGFSNSSSTNVQAVLGDFDSAIGDAGAQNLWQTIAGDTGSVAANISTDTLTIAGAGIASTAMSGDTLTVTATEADTLQSVAARGSSYTGGVTLATSSGSVGVGISPNAKFHVNAPAGTDIVRFQMNGSTRFFMDDDGQLGIGAYFVPSNALDVYGGMSIGTYNASTAPTSGLIVTGSVGIGTTSPGSKLEVYHSNSSLLTLSNFGSGWNEGDVMTQITLEGKYYSALSSTYPEGYIKLIKQAPNGSAGSALTFWTRQASGAVNERIRIDKNGNLGIGTTIPTATLHVGAGKTVSFPANSISDAMVSNTLTASDLVTGSSVVSDAEVDNNITLTNITQITTRSHTSLSDIGTNTHAQIDTHLGSSANPHSVTKAQVDLGNVDNIQQLPLSYLDTTTTLAADSDVKVASQHATKVYIDNSIAGLKWKDSVRVATTANGAIDTAFANGQSVDGKTLATGNRILLKNQSTGSQNGIYTVNASGAPTRTTDADGNDEIKQIAVFIEEGTLNADTAWVCSNDDAAITVGTTALIFAQFAGSQSYQAGSGITFSGNQINVGAGTGISVAADTVGIDNTVVATLSDTQTLTNKTLTSPKINEDVVLTPTSTELNYVDGVTSSIQTQIDGKSSASDTLTGLVQSTAAGTNYITGGNVGIGTTAPTALLNVSAVAGAPGTIDLSTQELTVVDGDVLGKIEFDAPLEDNGADAILVGAAIEAVAEGEFTADSNATELVFKTGASEAATQKMVITSAGRVGIGTTAPSAALSVGSAESFKVTSAGAGTFAGDLSVGGDLSVTGDQIISGTTLYDSAQTIRTDSAAALLVEKSGANGSGKDIFSVNTITESGTFSGGLSSVGLNAGSGLITTSGNIQTTATGVMTSAGLLTASAGISVSGGNIAITDASNIVLNTDKITLYGASGNATMAGTLTQLRSIGLTPDYDNATLRGDGSNNFGTLSLKYDSAHNYYEWTTDEPTTQDYDIVMRYRLPDGFSSFDASTPIKLWNKVSAAPGSTAVTVTMLDTAGASVTLTGGSNLQNTSWTETTITLDAAGKTFSQGGYITLIIKLLAGQGKAADIGELTLKGNW